MPFPSRGCRTCKQRRVKCDEARPICNRCQRAKIVCHTVKDEGSFVFLDENVYAAGRKKRPRGPNVNFGTTTSQGVLSPQMSTQFSQNCSVPRTLSIPVGEQALTYYFHHYVDAPQSLSGIMDGHVKGAMIDGCYSQPGSILSLAIFAISHATFGRARKSHASLAVASTKYSKALTKTNLALRNDSKAMNDKVLLAMMLLSYYENSVTGKISTSPSQSIQTVASQSFYHLEGAMAILKLRRQQQQRTEHSAELDKLVRRQLLRSILLRSIPVPPWLRDGSQYGEQGFVLEFDVCMVRAAELRHQASTIQAESAAESFPERFTRKVKLRSLLSEAQALDEDLVSWSSELSPEDRYITHIIQTDRTHEVNKTFDNTVHVYATVWHAGMWNRYRAVRLAVNDVIFKTLLELKDPDLNYAEEAAKSRTNKLADDLCASISYMLGEVVLRHDITIVSKTPTSLSFSVKASTASFLCWPLAMVAMMPGLSCSHQFYLRSRLLDVSEIVDDGLLKTVAEGFPNKVSHGIAKLELGDCYTDKG
ncbi:uncharacterized protein LY89DRAFT_658682 [Mollisia scopiformis]|uniref:Zn(2)-C6 fungal-type domain-containing protein n=1 Tax=Mollisia scopiformis TaxID=149040 RepID=A0A132BA97_MOLSC|nr:uncharacterized protein LY89DRAFT_658682 [Mollisia scopiformis]KUJ08919.1 hypothetical protein LY89DRAFT_658682 [Mollisia scopiformis]